MNLFSELFFNLYVSLDSPLLSICYMCFFSACNYILAYLGGRLFWLIGKLCTLWVLDPQPHPWTLFLLREEGNWQWCLEILKLAFIICRKYGNRVVLRVTYLSNFSTIMPRKPWFKIQRYLLLNLFSYFCCWQLPEQPSMEWYLCFTCRWYLWIDKV